MKAPVLFIGAMVTTGLVFLLLPGIDLATSRLFYQWRWVIDRTTATDFETTVRLAPSESRETR